MPVTLSAKWRNQTANSQVIADPGAGQMRCNTTRLLSTYAGTVLDDDALAYYRFEEAAVPVGTNGTLFTDNSQRTGDMSGYYLTASTISWQVPNPQMTHDATVGAIVQPLTWAEAMGPGGGAPAALTTGAGVYLPPSGEGLTIEFWITYQGIADSILLDGQRWGGAAGPAGTDGRPIRLWDNGTQLALQYNDDAGIVNTVRPTAAMTVGHTYHVVFRIVSGVVTLYLDGANVPLTQSNTQYRDLVVADGAVAYWRLNETSGTTAVDSIGGSNGTISGGVTLNQAGATTDGDSAMQFNGTGKVDVPLGAYSAFGTGGFTVEGWFKGVSQTNYPFTIGAAPLEIMLQTDSTSWYFTVAASGLSTQYIGVTMAYDDSAWHHIVGIIRRGSPDVGEIYIDGTLRNSVSLSASGVNFTATGITRIGAHYVYTAPTTYWTGGIDDVAIYKTALTAAQVKAHYDAGAAAPRWPALVRFLYTFNCAPPGTLGPPWRPYFDDWPWRGGLVDELAFYGVALSPTQISAHYMAAATPSGGVSRMALSATDASGLDATPLLSGLVSGDQLQMVVEWFPPTWATTIVTWQLTAAPINHGTWWELPVIGVSAREDYQRYFFEAEQMIVGTRTVPAAALAIGAIVTNGQPYQLVVAGTRALVVATGTSGALLVFQDGTQDWFDDAALSTYAVAQIASAAEFAGYVYATDLRVHEDFRAGFFDPVLTNPAAAAARAARGIPPV